MMTYIYVCEKLYIMISSTMHIFELTEIDHCNQNNSLMSVNQTKSHASIDTPIPIKLALIGMHGNINWQQSNNSSGKRNKKRSNQPEIIVH